MFRADLHTHTSCSDGTLAPLEVVALAKEVGLSALSITDHDTIDAYTPEIFEQGIEIMTGVEFSTRHKGVNVHLLGYRFEIKKLRPFCDEHMRRRKKRNKKILEKLEMHGIHIEKLEGEGRPHIAQKLVEMGQARDLQDAFSRFIGEGRPCYDAGMPFGADETIDHIHKAGGLAFIAHPHLIRRRQVIDSLYTFPIDGIECYYSILPSWREKEWVRAANKRNLLISGGSDFHGSIKPDVKLGCSWVDKETFERIVSHE